MEKNNLTIPDTWTFKSEAIANHFEEHAKASIPMYDEIQRMTGEIAQIFVRTDDTVIDLGCSTGNTMRTIDEALQRDVTIIGIDDSNEMLKQARKQTHLTASTLFIGNDLSKGLKFGPPLNNITISLITSIFTIQFINQEFRQSLINDIFSSLRNGGAFLMFEKIEGTNAKFNEMMTDFYNDMKVRNGLTPLQNHKKTKSLRGVMTALTLEHNLQMLKNAGFEKIETVFKWYNFVGILAIK